MADSKLQLKMSFDKKLNYARHNLLEGGHLGPYKASVQDAWLNQCNNIIHYMCSVQASQHNAESSFAYCFFAHRSGVSFNNHSPALNSLFLTALLCPEY